MSELLKAFYIAYQAWLDNGAPEDKPFTRRNGLCGNLRAFVIDNYSVNLLRQAWAELDSQFAAANFSVEYPFDFNMSEYQDMSDAEAHHLNTMRIRWVRDRVYAINKTK